MWRINECLLGVYYICVVVIVPEIWGPPIWTKAKKRAGSGCTSCTRGACPWWSPRSPPSWTAYRPTNTFRWSDPNSANIAAGFTVSQRLDVGPGDIFPVPSRITSIFFNNIHSTPNQNPLFRLYLLFLLFFFTFDLTARTIRFFFCFSVLIPKCNSPPPRVR